jgi:hypothetical protein
MPSRGSCRPFVWNNNTRYMLVLDRRSSKRAQALFLKQNKIFQIDLPCILARRSNRAILGASLHEFHLSGLTGL